jgi:hypothetical protein
LGFATKRDELSPAWAAEVGRLIRRRGRQAFVCAVVGGPARTGGKLGCAVERHS